MLSSSCLYNRCRIETSKDFFLSTVFVLQIRTSFRHTLWIYVEFQKSILSKHYSDGGGGDATFIIIIVVFFIE